VLKAVSNQLLVSLVRAVYISPPVEEYILYPVMLEVVKVPVDQYQLIELTDATVPPTPVGNGSKVTVLTSEL
jgi:hypothetical protein